MVRHPSPSVAPGGAGQREFVVLESGADHPSSGIATTSGAEIEGEGRRVVGCLDGEQRQEGDTSGLFDGCKEPLGSTLHSKVGIPRRVE